MKRLVLLIRHQSWIIRFSCSYVNVLTFILCKHQTHWNKLLIFISLSDIISVESIPIQIGKFCFNKQFVTFIFIRVYICMSIIQMSYPLSKSFLKAEKNSYNPKNVDIVSAYYFYYNYGFLFLFYCIFSEIHKIAPWNITFSKLKIKNMMGITYFGTE